MSDAEDIPVPPELFLSKEDAIRWLLDASAVRHKEARTERSCKTRVYFRCTDEECAFSCHINKGGDGVFRVTKLVWHSCGPFNKAKVKRAWVTEKAKAMIGERDGLKPKELQDRLRERHGVDVKIRAATKAVARAKKDHEDEEASFDKLIGLFQALREQNPGTVAEIAMDDGRFEKAFLCPGSCARAWSHCPKLIAVDGTHGKSAYKGVVLVATAMDGAGQIFPVAFGFVSSESNDSCRFFVEHLADALNIGDSLMTVLSDRCKGIDNAVTELLPRASHSYCAFHIRQNVAKYGSTAANFVWRIASASSEQEYDEEMTVLQRISPKAHECLGRIDKEHWVRAFFPMPRYGHLTSNIAESTNSLLRECRRRPPLRFFVMAIQKINETFSKMLEKYANGNETDIVDRILAEMVTRTEDGRKLEARHASGPVFEVQSCEGSEASRVVNLERRECSCMEFQDLGYPCMHACMRRCSPGWC